LTTNTDKTRGDDNKGMGEFCRDTMALLTPTQGGQKMEIKEAGKL